MELTLLDPQSYRRQPWKNGGGVTDEIAVDGAVPYGWRISLAQVDRSGPFSLFPDYDRVIVLLSGALTLEPSEGTSRPLRRLKPHRFPGEWAVTGRLEAPSQDFNLFVRRGQWRGEVTCVPMDLNEEVRFPLQGRYHLLFVVEGAVEGLEQRSEQSFTLRQFHSAALVRAPGEVAWDLRVQATAPGTQLLWVHLAPLGES